MHLAIQATPCRIVRRCALAAGLLVHLALSGCNEVETLEAIRQQQQAGDYEGSIEPLRELLAVTPDDAEANYLYGQALVFTQQPHLSVWSLRKAMKDPAWLVPAGLQLAFAALANRDFNEVVAIIGQVLEREPENVRALLMRASAYAHWKKDPELALADANRVLELAPDALEAYEPKILALLDLGRIKEASETLAEAGRRLVERGPSEGGEDVLAWHCSTTAAFEQASGDLEQARKTWTKCLDAHPTNLEVVSDAMSFYDSQGETERALEILRAAVAGDPTSRVLRITLAEWLRRKGDGGEAEVLLLEATRTEDTGLAAAAWLDLGKLRQAMGAHATAADAMERALELAKEAGTDNPQLQFEFADALVLAGRLERAQEVAEDLSVPAHRQLILARVAQEQRDPARAMKAFDEALRLWPDNPWARYYAALAAEELGDFERALAEYRYSVRIDPGATDARTRGAQMLLASGEPRHALQMLFTATDQAPLEIEGQLLSMRLSGQLGDSNAIAETLALIEATHPARAGRALAEAAEGLSQRGGPSLALSMLATAPNVDFEDPRYAVALRALVRFAHEADKPAEMQGILEKILEAQPDSSAFQEIHGFDLELSGAPAEAVRAAYARALELEPGNARALEDLGRLALRDDPKTALAYFDRATAADPSNPSPTLQAARALVAMGKPDEAEARLDALLLEHPFEAAAAAERARLDLEQEVATEVTLERARRAVRFESNGKADALKLLGRVHSQRDEPELAARAAERARVLREAREARASKAPSDSAGAKTTP